MRLKDEPFQTIRLQAAPLAIQPGISRLIICGKVKGEHLVTPAKQDLYTCPYVLLSSYVEDGFEARIVHALYETYVYRKKN
jgi:hypothetical protein